MRGTVLHTIRRSGQARITPACAGNSGFGLDSDSLSEDHPRVCGEQRNFRILHNLLQGSPPRVRGTESQWQPIPQDLRITPACAGNRQAKRFSGPAREDHPRVCGEQHLWLPTYIPDKGSPPRVRGAAIPQLQKPPGLGITPACAGNSNWKFLWRRFIKDHPRVCGEQPFLFFHFAGNQGSPPRVRGTGRAANPSLGVTRITPACAGNSKLRCFAGLAI